MSEPLFKPGDKVGCIFDDEAHIVQDGGKGGERDYPIYIDTKDGRVFLTAGGKYTVNHAYPVIWHWETGSPPKTGERPKWKPKKPTWCRCWQGVKEERLLDGGRVTLIIGERDGVYFGMDGWTYRYAEPCDPPDWWPKEWR